MTCCLLELHLARHSSHSKLLYGHRVPDISSSVSLQGTNLTIADACAGSAYTYITLERMANQDSSYCSCVSQGRKSSILCSQPKLGAQFASRITEMISFRMDSLNSNYFTGAGRDCSLGQETAGASETSVSSQQKYPVTTCWGMRTGWVT